MTLTSGETVSPSGTLPAPTGARARIQAHLVGRERELELVFAAVAAGRDIVLEGPPGTSKTTILKAITREWGIPLLFVEGNGDLSPTKMLGHHSPSKVLRDDYNEDNFVAGPLVRAMREGAFLYVEEFNRAPEDTLNTLLTAMADRAIQIPRVGKIVAAPSFRLVASMNPFDNIGTSRLSTSISDRMCRLSITYQTEDAERAIVALRAGQEAAVFIDDAVAVTRATRTHPALRQGSSVRGAIDLALIAWQLCAARGVTGSDRDGLRRALFDAMLVALSGRIHLEHGSVLTVEDVLDDIWQQHVRARPDEADPG